MKRQATHRQISRCSGQPLLGAHVFDDGLRRFLGGCVGLTAIRGDEINNVVLKKYFRVVLIMFANDRRQCFNDISVLVRHR